MTVVQNKELVRRQFELLSAGDARGAASLRADESFNHGRKVNPQMIESIYGSPRSLQERHAIHETVGEGEWVAVRTTCEGVHGAKVNVNGSIFADVEPTGRKYSVQHMHLSRVVDGKIKEHWANRDDLGAARQVGRELGPPKP